MAMRARIAAVSAALLLGGALGSLEPTVAAAVTPGAWGGAPSLGVARSSQTATRLFGGKVLVVGGIAAGQALASAELYDPSARTWTAASGLSAARFSHTATLLPNGRVVVVGGTGAGGQPLASTEIYDPAAGAWSTGGALSSARSSHTATLLSSGKILVAGGVGSNGQPLTSAELFNPTSGTWSPTGSMATARSSHTATLLSGGKVLVAGGAGVGGTPLASAELYDPTSGTWSATGSLASARSAHTATALGDANGGGGDPRVLVTGGVGSDGRRLASSELYDQTSGAWTSTGALHAGRSSSTATLLPNGLVLVAGGAGPGASPGSSAELYDPATGRWSPTGPLATARTTDTATLLLSGEVLVAGGTGAAGASLASAELYDPDLGARWEPTGSLRVARSGHTATLLPDGDVLVAGGQSTTTASTPPRIIAPLASAELYHPRTGTWTATGSLGQARSFQTSTLLQGSPSQCASNCGKVLVAGGIAAANATGRAATIASAELYDPATGRWSPTGSMTTARALHTATLLPSGRVLVVAGAGPGGAEPTNANQLASAELYDPLSGTWTATGSMTGTTSPPASNTPRGARLGQSAVLLDRGACGGNCGKVLVVAGVGGAGAGPALASAELYDPSTGTFRATASLDQARQGQSAALLPNGKVLVIGGFHDPFGTGPPDLNTAELYDPATETWSATGPLTARRLEATATLLRNGQVLVAGGAGGGNAPSFSNEPGPGLLSSELFDAGTNTWSRTSFLNTARVYHTATLLPSGPSSLCAHNCGKVLVAGGNAELVGTFAPYFNLQSPLSSAELYAPPQPPAPRPVIKGLRIVPAAFRAARSGPSATRASARHRRGTGARVSYTLNVAAGVRFTVVRLVGGRRAGHRCVAERKGNRRSRRCTRAVRVRGSFTLHGNAGRDSFRFTGRVGGRRLARGVYQLLATPSVNGRGGKSSRETFRIRA
jgi:N-acetylneuraminic acid mutarotase